MAFDIALPFWNRGYRVLANVPHNFVNRTGNKDFDLYKTVVIVDEGGEYIREAKDASLLTRPAGKANYYVIFSGKRMPHKNLQDIVVKPRFDFWKNYGIPLILWRAKVNADEKYIVPFWQLVPQLIHGTYSTKTSSGDITQLLQMALITVERLANEEGQKAGKQNVAGLYGFADDLAENIRGALS